MFFLVRAISLVTLSLQSSFLELAASHASFDLKTKWFESLLRQDMAYYDMNNVSGQATIISTNSNKFKRGIGRKFGEMRVFIRAGWTKAFQLSAYIFILL